MLEGFDARVQERLLRDVGRRVTGILETTRETIQREVERGVEEGLGAAELGDRIEVAAAFDEYRAEMIARTETATMLNQAAVASYREYGVTHVTVIDGDDDDECAAANGQTWTLEEAEANPIAHPNCVRDFAPILGEVAEREEGAAERRATTDETITYPPPDTSPEGVEDATSAWSGIHYADLREYQISGTIREGMSLAEDPLHGIAPERAAQSVSTLTRLIAEGDAAPPLFRGIPVDDAAFERFLGLRAGQTQDMALSSWSSNAEEAAKFAARTRDELPHQVLMQATDVQGFDMSKYSFYPGEKEWITNGRFTVESVEQEAETLVVRFRQEAVFDVPKGGSGG